MVEELGRSWRSYAVSGFHGIDDRDLFDSAAARRLVVLWKLRHKLEPPP